MIISAGPLLNPKLLFRQETEKLSNLPPGTLTFTASGRSAFISCIRQLAISPKTTVLLPAYVCPAVVEPFKKLGIKIVYYPLSRDLKPDISFLKSAFADGLAGALVVIHYFGFPVKNFEEILELCREHYVTLIEDCAHALFSRYRGQPLGVWGDGAIFSFRKSLPLPEGGVAVVRRNSGFKPVEPLPFKLKEFINLGKEELFFLESVMGLSLKNYLLGSARIRRWLESRNRMPAEIYEEKMGSLSYWLFKRVDAFKAVEKRVNNYNFLYSRLKESKNVKLLTGKLTEGVCPIGMPVLIENRDRWRDYFYRKGFGLRSFWDLLPDDVQCFADSVWVSRRVLVLPVHEDLSSKQRARLVDEFSNI